MKNYIQRIIRLFATSDPDPKLTGEIHRWLLDQEHAGEKETALHDYGTKRKERWTGLPGILLHRYIPKSEPTPGTDISHVSVSHIMRLP